MVRVEYPDGEKQFFEGEQGSERLVRVEYPDGHNLSAPHMQES